MAGLPAAERVILAIDTSREVDAERLARLASDAGARFVKLGLELSSATSWQYCSDLASANRLDWVADAKLDDIPNTVGKTVKNIVGLAHPPFGITMHTTAGREAMRVAQEEAGENIKMLGVTVLTSIDEDESWGIFGTPPQAAVMDFAHRATVAGLQGLVCSPQEVGMVKNNPETAHLFTMIPGTRSVGADQGDQVRVATPEAAIRDGADLLVIGRQITAAADPALAYEQVVAEIEGAL